MRRPAKAMITRSSSSRADLGWGERFPALLLLAALFLLGFFPRVLSDPVDQALQAAVPAVAPAVPAPASNTTALLTIHR